MYIINIYTSLRTFCWPAASCVARSPSHAARCSAGTVGGYGSFHIVASQYPRAFSGRLPLQRLTGGATQAREARRLTCGWRLAACYGLPIACNTDRSMCRQPARQAEAPDSGLKNLRFCSATPDAPPQEVLPPPGPRRYWRRRIGCPSWSRCRRRSGWCVASRNGCSGRRASH